MTQEQMLQQSDNFNSSLQKKGDKPPLITNDRNHPTIPFYMREYQGKRTYIAYFETELPQSGVSAFQFTNDDLYRFPIHEDFELIKSRLKGYSSCDFLSCFVSGESNKESAIATIQDYAATFGFQGELTVKQNMPNPQHPLSWRLQINRSAPREPQDWNKSASFASQLKGSLKK